jgi:hypothetical protein
MDIEGIGRVSFETRVTLSVGSEVAYASPDIGTFRPNGVGTTTQLGRYGALSNWDCVDEVTSDGDTSYVWGTVSGAYQKDTYATPDPATRPGTINKVIIKINCERSSGQGLFAKTVVRTGGTDYEGIEITLTNSYVVYSTEYPTKPGGGSWTWADIDAMEIGVVLKSTLTGGKLHEARCTQVWAEVDYTPSTPDILNIPPAKNFGIVDTDSSYWSKGGVIGPNWTDGLNDSECYFTLTNNSSAPVNVTIRATNFLNPDLSLGWTLVPTNPSGNDNQVRLKAGKSGDATEGNMVILFPPATDQPFITGLGIAPNNTKMWEVKLETGTFTDEVEKTSTITLTATYA